MKLKWIVLSALALSLIWVSPAMMKAHAAVSATSAAAIAQDHDWDQPPQDYRDVQRQGFHDGVEAARHDFERHRHADADDHERYKHPPCATMIAMRIGKGSAAATSALCRIWPVITIMTMTIDRPESH